MVKLMNKKINNMNETVKRSFGIFFFHFVTYIVFTVSIADIIFQQKSIARLVQEAEIFFLGLLLYLDRAFFYRVF